MHVPANDACIAFHIGPCIDRHALLDARVMKAAQNNAAAKAAPPGPTPPLRCRRHMTTPTHLGKTHPPPRRHVLASPSTATPPPPPAVDARRRPRPRLPRALTNTMRIVCTCLPRGRSSGQAETFVASTKVCSLLYITTIVKQR